MVSNNRLFSIELPTCNKENFEKYTLQMFPLIQPLSKYAKFNVNFQKQFTQTDVENYIEIFDAYGFELSYALHTYSNPQGFNSIVRIREDTHDIDPTCPFIFSIDDDIEVLNVNYTRALLASLYHLLVTPTSGVECIEGTRYGRNGILYDRNLNRKMDEVDKCSSKHMYLTDGGILVRNLKNFHGLFPADSQDLLGSGQDILLVHSRICNGLTAYRTIAPYFKHAELRIENHRLSGYYRHGWNIAEQTATNTVHSYIDQNLKINKETYDAGSNYNFAYDELSVDELIKMIDCQRQLINK